MTEGDGHIIKEKLNHFIKRFYWQQVIHGLLSTFAIAGILWVSFSALAFLYFLSSDIRFFLWTSLWLVGLSFGIKDIIIPIIKLLNLGRRMSDEKAAKIIGTHFPGQVDDKLLNAIHLLKSKQNNNLIIASIAQKSAELKTINFLSAVPVEQVKRAMKIAAVPLVVLIGIALIKPTVITKGTQRMMDYDEEFLPENPYRFQLLNKKLQGTRNEAFEIQIQYLGSEIPMDAYIEINGILHRMANKEGNLFSHHISHLQEHVLFKIKSGIHFSKGYSIAVIDRPTIKGLKMSVKEPGYIGGKTYTKTNDGNLTVPQGSQINWIIKTAHCDSFLIVDKDKSVLWEKKGINTFQLRANESIKYQIALYNSFFDQAITYEYEIEVVKDDYPMIDLKQLLDTAVLNVHHIKGFISDDHGFSALKLHYTVKDSTTIETLPLNLKLNQQGFYKALDFSTFNLKEGQGATFFFEVIDNDLVNGPKSSFSTKMTFSKPSKSEVDSIINQSNEEIKTLIANSMSKSQALQEKYKEIRKMLLEKKELSWQEQEKIKNFLEYQQSFEKDLKKLQQMNQTNDVQKQSLTKKEQDLLNKQKQINELFEELMDEETKKLFDEIEKLMEEMNKKKRESKLEEMNLSNENLEKSLDRTLELFKQMEFAEELDKTVKNLEELSKKQEDLSKKTKETNNKELEKVNSEQKYLKKEFDRLAQKIENLKEKNKKLENAHEFENTAPEKQQVSQEMNKASDELSKKQKKAAAKSQKKSSDGLKKMANKMSKMQQKMGEQQEAEDLNSMRQLLENLIFLSVEQEKLLEQTKHMRRYDANFDQQSQQQQKLRDDAKVIEDSLFALSKRQSSLASYINKEIHEITFNQQKSLTSLAKRNGRQSAMYQQYVMTSANNLALILDESIQNMQNSMMQQKFGQGSCNKPGGSKPKPGQGMKSLQKALSKQLEQMRKQLKKQGSQPGKTGKKGEKGEAKAFGQMAAQQGAIKEQLKKLSERLQNQSKGGLGDAKNLEQKLNETEKELLNKNITPESIRRQEEILTRLLEAEKALKERGFEEKRISKKGKKTFNRNPEEFLEYTKVKISDEEILKVVLPSLNLFYKKKVNEYFNAVDK